MLLSNLAVQARQFIGAISQAWGSSFFAMMT